MTRHSPRERIVYGAAQSLRRRGASGTGLRGLVAEADAPWGSLHHYFPGGKDQLVGEALAWSAELAASRVQDYLGRARTPTAEGLLDDLVDTWVTDLEGTGFLLGCPVVGAVADGATESSAAAECERALQTWRAPMVDGLASLGLPRRRATDLATLMIATVEGAILMARIQRSAEPLRAVRRALRPLLREVDRESAADAGADLGTELGTD